VQAPAFHACGLVALVVGFRALNHNVEGIVVPCAPGVKRLALLGAGDAVVPKRIFSCRRPFLRSCCHHAVKTNLIQQKAWSANDVGKRIQASAICIANNLFRVIQVRLKVEDGIEDK
jgi:hypothetical protein